MPYKVTTDVYTYDELSPGAQEKAYHGYYYDSPHTSQDEYEQLALGHHWYYYKDGYFYGDRLNEQEDQSGKKKKCKKGKKCKGKGSERGEGSGTCADRSTGVESSEEGGGVLPCAGQQ